MKKVKNNKSRIEESIKTKNEILQAAIEVFVKNGFVSSTLEQIARKAGVTRGAVYWHFKNKYKIFEALHDKLHQPLTASIIENLQEKTADSLQQLQKLCIKLLIDLDNDQIRKKILKIFLCKCDYSGMENILKKQRERKLKNIELFSQYFKEAKKNNLLPQENDPNITAISLVCYMSGIVTEYLRNPQLFNLKKQAPYLIKQFFTSYKK